MPPKKAGEHLSGVADGLGGAELDVVLQQREGATAEALNANLKGNPGPCGGLFVDGADGQRVEWKEIERHFVALFPQPLELNGPLQYPFKILVDIINGQKVLHHAISTARRLLSVVRSVLFVLDVGGKPVPCVAHAAEERLCEGQDVSEPFLKLR